ncbi:lipoprotein lipase isoform X2 [Plutella xylostella]|uniref:lipoprotein lipase isoform X2 n=1 Tax=Plutella xylostella TaxID=51655 RepID=UPI0020329B5E|nr:lipoprotein lipase isoform X2 [Plutella xylostella]
MKFLIVLSAVLGVALSSSGLPLSPAQEEALRRQLLQQEQRPAPAAAGRDGSKNEYWLYTRRNPTVPQFLLEGDERALNSSHYSRGADLRVVVHGLNNNGNAAVNVLLTEGMDPAGPSWRLNPLALNREDARYVEAIHTDGNILGIFDPIGHANFYPNGGMNPQPGCLISTCSHSRSYQLMAASVKLNHLVARECGSLLAVPLGLCGGPVRRLGNDDLDKEESGIYYLSTDDKYPYYS